MAAFDAVVSWIRDHWELLAAILLAPFAPVILIVGVFRARLLDAFEAVVHGIVAVIDWFRRLPGDVVRALGDMVATVFHIMLTAVTWFDNNVGGPLRSWFTALPGRAVSWLGDMVATAFHVMLTANSWFINNVGAPLYNFFSRLPANLRGALGDIVGTIFSGLTNALSWLHANVYLPVVGFFQRLPGEILGALGNIGSEIWHHIISGIPGAGAVGGLIHSITGGVGGFLHGIGLAEGGHVTKPMLALVGESGPEWVVPDDTLRDWAHRSKVNRLPSSPGFGSPPAGAGAPGFVGGSANVHIHPGAVVLNIGTNLTAETRLQAEALTTSAIRTLAQEMRAGVAPLRLGL